MSQALEMAQGRLTEELLGGKRVLWTFWRDTSRCSLEYVTDRHSVNSGLKTKGLEYSEADCLRAAPTPTAKIAPRGWEKGPFLSEDAQSDCRVSGLLLMEASGG